MDFPQSYSLGLFHEWLRPDGTLRVTVSNCTSGLAKSTLEARLDPRRLPLLLRTMSEQQEALAGPP
ncbi:hypothetical protein ASPFODRAFT_54173 [Aspergillus luchuensis CBS 106.47]|uniref:Uncharacterized protein n=1 Tax=Aspergillus luchuensis (strain CBS 106.47) TaxID=1137211 RepID=A0A1M3SZU7_ASPLC|nr:hypothetical protein ASPFODRAFT_54173 [Aspergillus luchuensis CBS 106.47]